MSGNIIRFIFNQIDTLCSKVQLYSKTDHLHEVKKEPFQALLSHNFSQEEAHLSFLLFYGYFIG